MRILFIDDDPEHVELVSRTLRDALDAESLVVDSVEDAVLALQTQVYDVVVTDIFIPLGDTVRASLGPRATSYAENVQHLGGLVLLDELERVEPRPAVLVHTACTDFELLELLDEVVTARIPKPAPVDVLLRAVLEALNLPTPQ